MWTLNTGEEISESQLESMFDDFLDELMPPVTIGKFYEFAPSRALKTLDPIAYREEFLNWADSEEIGEI